MESTSEQKLHQPSDTDSASEVSDVEVVTDETSDVLGMSAAERLASELARLDLASDDTPSSTPQPTNSNDEVLRREVPPHHI